MKPKVIHLVDDQKLGGVQLAVQSLCHSNLNQEFDFEIHLIHLLVWKPVRYQADIICLHAAASWRKLPAMLLLRLANLGIPIIFQEHHYSEGFVLHQVKIKWRFFMMLKFSYCLMDKVLAVSNEQGKWLLNNKLVYKKKLVVVGQAKPLSSFISLPQRMFSWPLVIGAYGRFHNQKGFELLLQAVSEFSPDKVKLKLAGSGEQASCLHKLADKGHSDGVKIEFLGEIHEVPRFLQSCDLIIIPSRWEPFGLTCQESLAAGKLVIANDIDGLTDQVNDVNSAQSRPPSKLKCFSSQLLDELSVTSLVGAINNQITAIEAHETACLNSDFIYGLNQQQRQKVAQAWPLLVQSWGGLLKSVLSQSRVGINRGGNHKKTP